jgi:hypothetical protein
LRRHDGLTIIRGWKRFSTDEQLGVRDSEVESMYP